MTDQTIPEFVESRGIKLSILDGPIPGYEDDWEYNGYRVQLRRKTDEGKTRSMAVQWRQGLGIENPPTAADVLNAVLLDSEFGEYDWDEFCRESGYDRHAFADASWDDDAKRAKDKAEKLWRACKRERQRLPEFLGGESEYDTLRECERL